MIGRTLRGVTCVGVVFAIAGCPQKQTGGADGASDAAPVSAVVVDAAPPSEAANESDIKRYPDEQKIDHAPAQVAWYVANVRSEASSGSGTLISVLKKGTDTIKIGSKDTFNLVTFADPSSPGRRMMGWLDQKVYTPQNWDAGKHWITCNKPQVSILLQTGELCVTPCSSANDTCPASQVCDGDAPKSNQGQAGDNVEFCRTGDKKGGTTPTPPTPTTVDAAAPAVADAAVAAKVIRVAHAADAGPCPANMTQAGQFCRLNCTTSADCGGTSACKAFSGKMLCQDPG